MNASGTLGFVPDPYGPVDLSRFGAFITNPFSHEARTPAHGKRVYPFPGGFLLHTGYPNPGLKVALRRYATRWSHSSLPVIVHLLPENVAQAAEMVRLLESVDGLLAVEVGLPPEVDAAAAAAFARAACGELPVIMRLPFDHPLDLARAVAEAEIAAVGLAPPPRGCTVFPENLVHGRLYGPALFPQALDAVHTIAQAGIPVDRGRRGIPARAGGCHAVGGRAGSAGKFGIVAWGLGERPEITGSPSGFVDCRVCQPVDQFVVWDSSMAVHPMPGYGMLARGREAPCRKSTLANAPPLRFQPRRRQFGNHSVMPRLRYSKSVYISTWQAWLRAFSASTAAVNSIRLLVVAGALPVSAFSCLPERSKAAQPPRTGIGHTGPIGIDDDVRQDWH